MGQINPITWEHKNTTAVSQKCLDIEALQTVPMKAKLSKQNAFLFTSPAWDIYIYICLVVVSKIILSSRIAAYN